MTIKYFAEKSSVWGQRATAIGKFDVEDDGLVYIKMGVFCSGDYLESNWTEISEEQFNAIATLIEDVQTREREIAKMMTLQNEIVALISDTISGISDGEIVLFDRGDQRVKERDFGFRIIS